MGRVPEQRGFLVSLYWSYDACVYVVPASEDLDEYDRLCLISHHRISLMQEKEPWRNGRGVGEALDLPLSSRGLQKSLLTF